MSVPVPSPSMKGMIGWSGTWREKSELTLIFCPEVGTLMCWYMGTAPSGGMLAPRMGGMLARILCQPLARPRDAAVHASGPPALEPHSLSPQRTVRALRRCIDNRALPADFDIAHDFPESASLPDRPGLASVCHGPRTDRPAEAAVDPPQCRHPQH